MKSIITILQGAVMGTAELIPGISGSTLALTMGIYDEFVELLHSVSEVVKTLLLFVLRRRSFSQLKAKLKKIDGRFAVLLLFGMILAIGLLSGVLSQLLDDYPAHVYAVFTGIIIASIYIPARALKGISIEEFAVWVVSFMLMFFVFGLTPTDSDSPSLVLVYFGGIVGISGLFLPGVSGSFILLVLGIYHYVIDIVKHTFRLQISSDELVSLLVFIAGLATGFMVSVKVLKYLLAKQYRYLMAFVGGLMMASIRVLWPFLDGAGEKVSPFVLEAGQLVTLIILIVFAAGFTLYVASRTDGKTSSK